MHDHVCNNCKKYNECQAKFDKYDILEPIDKEYTNKFYNEIPSAIKLLYTRIQGITLDEYCQMVNKGDI